MRQIKAFVSSVQRELENERVAIPELIALDPFLNRHIRAILFEEEPASSSPAQMAYLEVLGSCEIYLGILGFEYGSEGDDGLSATHREYCEARRLGMPTYFFVKGDNSQDSRRQGNLRAFFETIRDEREGHVYRRFSHYRHLKKQVRSVLLMELAKRGLFPTEREETIANQSIAEASDFDARLVAQVDDKQLDPQLCLVYAKAVTGKFEDDLFLTMGEDDLERNEVRKALTNRGLLWFDDAAERYHPTAAGLLLLGKNPEVVFPQARISANAYGGIERGEPLDRDDIKAAMPFGVERAFQFLKRNMRHTARIQGFSKVEIDEYPYEALREAVVNAVAHRDYDLMGSCIRIEKYADRIEILSPGLPPEPITLDKINRLDYIACSRNPNLARGLSYFERIEEQGDGLRRIVNMTTDLGLPRPRFEFRDGHFCVVFFGPGENIGKLGSQSSKAIFRVTDTVLAGLSTTQKQILKILLEQRQVRVPELAEALSISPQAIRKALKILQNLDLVVQTGKARGTAYHLKEQTPG